MLNALLPAQFLRWLEWQFIRMVPPVAVMRIVSDMVVGAMERRRGVQWIVAAIRHR